MEAAIIASITAVATAVIGYLQVKEKSKVDNIENALKQEKEHSVEQDERINELKLSYDRCEEDRRVQNVRITELVDAITKIKNNT